MSALLPVASNIDLNAKIYDNVYQTNSNMLESVARVISNRSAKLSLPSKAFGNTVQVNIPRGNMLVGHTSLNLKLKANQIPDGAYLPQNWVYDAIRYIEFQFGNSEKLRYEGKHLLIKNLADCESGEKKSVMQNVSGDKKTAKPAGGNRTSYLGCATIYLPFSNMSAARCMPFDNSILNSNIEITIELAPADQVFRYTLADAAAVRPTLPTDYADAYVSCKTLYMVDGSSDSIRELVSMRGNDKYSYGYIYPQTFQDSQDVDGIAASDNGRVSIELTRFLNASLQSMDIFVERVTLGNTVNIPAGAPANAPLSNSVQPSCIYIPISNIELSYAGQPIYRADDTSGTLDNLSEYPTSTTFDVDTYNYVQATGPAELAVQGNTPSYWTHIQLSQYNERFFTNLVQSGVALNSNEVLLTFNTPELADLPRFGLGVGEITIQPRYRVRAVYNYQAAVRTAKGETNLVFQPPLKSLPQVSGIVGTF